MTPVARRENYRTLPPFEVHSPALTASFQPWPLHEFLPLHEDDEVLQALVPLHELMPLHLMAPCADAADTRLPAANNTAAEAARRVRLFIVNSSTRKLSNRS